MQRELSMYHLPLRTIERFFEWQSQFSEFPPLFHQVLLV